MKSSVFVATCGIQFPDGDWTRGPCSGNGVSHWATREVPPPLQLLNGKFSIIQSLLFLKTTKNPNTHELPVRNNPVGDHSGTPTADSREKLTVGSLWSPNLLRWDKPRGAPRETGLLQNNPTPVMKVSEQRNGQPGFSWCPNSDPFLLTLPCSLSWPFQVKMARRVMSVRGQAGPASRGLPWDNALPPRQSSPLRRTMWTLKPGYSKTIQPMPPPKSFFCVCKMYIILKFLHPHELS